MNIYNLELDILGESIEFYRNVVQQQVGPCPSSSPCDEIVWCGEGMGLMWSHACTPNEEQFITCISTLFNYFRKRDRAGNEKDRFFLDGGGQRL